MENGRHENNNKANGKLLGQWLFFPHLSLSLSYRAKYFSNEQSLSLSVRHCLCTDFSASAHEMEMCKANAITTEVAQSEQQKADTKPSKNNRCLTNKAQLNLTLNFTVSIGIVRKSFFSALLYFNSFSLIVCSANIPYVVWMRYFSHMWNRQDTKKSQRALFMMIMKHSFLCSCFFCSVLLFSLLLS